MMTIDSILEKLPISVLDCMFDVYHQTVLQGRYKELLDYYEDNNAEDDWLAKDIRKRKTIDVFYGDWTYKYERKRYLIKQRKSGLYVMHRCLDGNKRRMFFKDEMKRGFAEFYYRGLMKEQDAESPHCYLNEDIVSVLMEKPKGIVLDIGAAEGIFALHLSGLYRKCYMFEPEKSWIHALKKTFKGRSGDIGIVPKFVSDEPGNNTVTIDSFFGDSIPRDISVIKMDIEGFEPAALRGMKRTLETNPDAILLVCAYHNKDDEQKIRDIVEPMGYEVKPHNGYMFFWTAKDFAPPYKRRGVLEIRKRR